MKFPVLNIDGAKSDSIEISDKLVKLKVNHKLIKFVIDWQLNHLKPRTAKTKQRNQIKGSTVKIVAQKGSGAFRFSNDQWNKISVTKVSELPKCRTVGSRHHLSDKEKSFIKKLGIEDFTSIGSSLKVGKISSGEAEAYITTTNKMKDIENNANAH